MFVQENGRLESELMETTEKLVEAENQLNKVQKNLDGVMKEKVLKLVRTQTHHILRPTDIIRDEPFRYLRSAFPLS